MILMIEHRVDDFDRWLPVFQGSRETRERHGATGHLVYRSYHDPEVVAVMTQFPDEEHAMTFLNDPSLIEAMNRGGVQGDPQASLWTEEDAADYRVEEAA